MLKVSEDVEAVIGRKFATKYYISTLVRKYINEYNLSEYFSTTNDPMTRLYFVPDEKLKTSSSSCLEEVFEKLCRWN